MIDVYGQGRLWSSPKDADYALDLEEFGRPGGRAAPVPPCGLAVRDGDARHAWLNDVVTVTKSRTGDGGPIHRVFAVM